MAKEITMPSMGADMTEGTIVKWLKQEGDKVSKGDKLAEIETDKTVVEMESYNEGILKKILVKEGTKIGVGKTIAYIGDPNDEVPEEGLSGEKKSDDEEKSENLIVESSKENLSECSFKIPFELNIFLSSLNNLSEEIFDIPLIFCLIIFFCCWLFSYN